ncbi:BRISC and BRCA1-A complex member 1 [Callorhinchus milii]|uniref:BRISC and BRCA1-A complex member 1 n=1 Tax=Callorhinchus milii TaxID=7868 RepID=A0A4W3H788_CALMI|nr:BRISC and BRCA1-A complex member 1 [Callorhinchus milii]
MSAAVEEGREAPAGSEPEPEDMGPPHRPSTRSNPEGAEDRQDPPGQAPQASVRDGQGEGDGEAGTESPGAAAGRSNGGLRQVEQEGQALPQSHSQPQLQPQPQAQSPFQFQTPPEILLRTPKVNCPEKVIICLDLSEEMSLQKLESLNGLKTNALNIAQKMIEMFVRTKHKIDKRHEFALVVVNDEVTWLSGFTSDPREVCSCLYDLDTSVCDSFNLDGLFNLIQQKIELPITENIQTIPPPYIVRMILIYIRASCHPQLASMERLNKILQSAYFFFDVIYIHNGTEEMEETSNNKEIYSFFNQLDTKGTSYKYDVSLTGQALELHNCMAKLLAHPLQRPFQMHAVYSLLEDEEAVEVEATV